MKAHDVTWCLAAVLGGVLLAGFANPTSAGEAAPVFSPYLAVESAKAPDLAADAADRLHLKAVALAFLGRAQALLGLKRANPDLTISFTLPVRPHGIPKGNGLEVLQSAAELGYSPDIVSFMTMDYFVDPGSSTLYRLTERAMDNAARQIKDLGLNSKLGVIPMIGQNDNRTETFTLDDARTLMRYVRAHPDIVRTSLWSLERDNGGCAGKEKATDTCSGVAQEDLAVSRTLSQFR